MKQRGICVLVFCLGFCSQASGQGGIITTVAGNGGDGFSGDGGPATSTSLWSPSGVAVDASGNFFVADRVNNRIRKVSPSGIITTIAGQGSLGFSGDGGPATAAALNNPDGVAVDTSGNIFIADDVNNRIRKVSPSGIITTVAGQGSSSFAGDGGPATSASLTCSGVAVDASGNLFIADYGNARIRMVSPSGIIKTVAGNGTFGFSGDSGPATSASLSNPSGVAVDASGNLFIADFDNQRIRKVSSSGIITTVAGNGYTFPNSNQGTFSGDGGPATLASLNLPAGVAVDASGNLFIADFDNNRIREVSPGGIITTIAGSYSCAPRNCGGFSGDGEPATSAELYQPTGVAVDASGNLFIADAVNNRIREMLAPGSSTLTVSAVNLSFSLFVGESSSKQISLASTASVAWSASTSSNWITLSPTSGTAPGTISIAVNTASLQPGAYTASITISNPSATPPQETVSVSLTVAALAVTPAALNFQIQQGTPAQSQWLQIGGTAGTAWQATAATTSGGAWLSVSPGAGQIPALLTALVNSIGLTAGTYQGSITIQAPGITPSSSTINVTLTVTAATGQSGIISTVAGSGPAEGPGGFSGDGGPATSAELWLPKGVAVDASGNLFIADSDNSRVRKVAASGIITTVAGDGIQGSSGDGGPATSAHLIAPFGVALDNSGNLFIADYNGNLIRKVSASGIITTVAGGRIGGLGDGGPATSAELDFPAGIAVDASGDLFIADANHNRIREVSASGIITTVAGNGSTGFAGDGGPATSASLDSPAGVAVDASGNLFIADLGNKRVRKVSASGIITTVAGNGNFGVSGDGGLATLAWLSPAGVAVDASGNLFIADYGNSRIRKVAASGIITTVAGGNSGFSGDGGPATSASLFDPYAVTVDASGNLFIADSDNNRIRKVSAPISTILPAPVISGLSPSSVTAGGPAFTLAVNGSGFVNGSNVEWNGLAVATSYISANQLSATLPASLIASQGTVSITVLNTGASASNDVAFTINPPPPVISGLSPSSVTAGGPAFTLAVNGSGFVNGSNVEWNGSGLATSYVSANQLSAALPASLIASPGGAIVTVVNIGVGASNGVTFAIFSSGPNVQTISHIADGGGWRSSIILVNTDTVPALYTVSFWNDSGASYVPPSASGATSGSLPVGGSTIIETADTASALSEGWAEVTSSQSIGGTAIFRYDPRSQEAAVPLLTSGGVKLEIPYQVGNGLALGIALANPSATQTANITEIIRDQNGNQLASRTLTLPALNHTGFNPTFPSGISGGGVVEYDSNVNIFALGIRSAPEGVGMAFTSLDAVLPLAASTKTISHIADGGGWRTSIILVNTDTLPALYTVSLWNDSGGSYVPPLALGATSGSLPVGGSTIIETADTASALSEGWAEVTSSQSIGGTAIFRYDPWSQEAAVPLLTSGSVKLEIPYQVGNGLSLGVALANPSATQTANITEVIRDQNGNQLASRTLTLPALNHTAFNPTFPSGLTGGGVVEYDSNVNIFALGIRSAPEGGGLAFTSVRAAYK